MIFFEIFCAVYPLSVKSGEFTAQITRLKQNFLDRTSLRVGQIHPEQARVGGRLVNDRTAAQHDALADVRALRKQGGLRAEIGHIAVGSAAEAVIGQIQRCDGRPLTAVREGGVAVALQHEGEVAVQMLAFRDLLAGVNLSEAVDALVTQMAEEAVEKLELLVEHFGLQKIITIANIIKKHCTL